MVTKKWDAVPKYKWILAQITQLFRLRRTQLNGIISSPCPEVTLDTFGFPVGAHSAARQAVVWPQLPKITIFGPKMHINPLYRIASYDTAWN